MKNKTKISKYPNTKKLWIFINRMKKLGINIELVGNFPWIYIHKINGQKVTEQFHAEHGFTIGFQPITKGGEFEFTSIKEIFKLIKKYK